MQGFRWPTWIHFTVASDTVGIDQVLEADSKLVGAVEGWRHHSGSHAVDDGLDGTPRTLLRDKTEDYILLLSWTILNLGFPE